jgi:hypothetical protein
LQTLLDPVRDARRGHGDRDGRGGIEVLLPPEGPCAKFGQAWLIELPNTRLQS